MLYLKKADLAKTYHISEKTVTNWIREVRNGKLDIELYEKNGKAWIANTTKNIQTIKSLIEDRRKFRNTRGVKTITPRPEFYELYTQKQILDLTTYLDIHREIPLEYAYFGGGATYWDKYVNRLSQEQTVNNLTNSVHQLSANQGYIDDLLARYKRVNVIDIGVGNSLPIRQLLQHLLDQNKLSRYIAVDISPAMLRIAGGNIQEWFGGKVNFESFQADINYDRFAELLADEVVGENSKDAANLIFALGGTFANLRYPDGAFKIIHDSMNRNDIFVYDLKLDTKAARQYFDLGIRTGASQPDAHKKMVVDLLNIDDSMYDVEMGYDEQLSQRYIHLRLKVALTIEFVMDNGKRIVELSKNDAILLWRSWHQNVKDVVSQLERNGFDVMHASKTEDNYYVMTVSRVKRES